MHIQTVPNYSFLFLIFLMVNISTPTSCLITLPPGGVKLPLIHRSSLPGYSNETFQSIVRRNHKFLSLKFAAALQEAKYVVQTPLIHFSDTGAVYFINITIGNPRVPQFLLIDTGSSLTWVRNTSTPPRQYFYNPDASDTFKYVTCGDPICASNFVCHDVNANQCGYAMSYMDSSKSSGVIGYDSFGFVNYFDPENPSIMQNVLFGARGDFDTTIDIDNDPRYYGIFGLGPESISLVSNLPTPKIFRYCVANLSKPDELQGYFFAGEPEGDYDDVDTTPMIQGYHHYIVEIASICLSTTCLQIDPSVFKNVQGNAYTGVLIDTGSVLSYLPDVAYYAVKYALSEMMTSKNKSDSLNFHTDKYLCYNGKLNDIGVDENYPDLIINFAGGGAKLIIAYTDYFSQTFSSSYCLSFGKMSQFGEEFQNYTVLGLVSQQNHVLEFDLDNWTMGIYRDKYCDVPL